MKKFFVLLLVLVMLLALSACEEGQQNPEDHETNASSTVPSETDSTVPSQTEPSSPVVTDPALVGLWETTIQVQGTTEGFDAALEMHMTFQFNADGTVETKIDEDALRQSLADYKEALIDYFVQSFYGQNGGEAAAEDKCLSEMGMTCLEFAQTVVGSMDLDGMMFNSMITTTTDTWFVEDGTLWIDDSAVDYQVEGNRLTMTGEGDLFDSIEALGQNSLVLEKVE